MRVTFHTVIEHLGRPGHRAALLVGAGMSAEAGIPMATKDLPTLNSVVTQIAEHLFFRAHRRLPFNRQELHNWLKREGLLQHPATQYSDALQLIAADNEGRQRYLEQFFIGRRPTASHEAVARFVSRGFFRSTFTTNFDPLLERALLFAGLDVAVAADPDVVRKLAATTAPVVYKVHGDYLLTNHKHTVEETKALEQAMHDRLVQSVAERSLLVIGYSGSDPSIIDALAEGLAAGQSSEVLWLLFENEAPGPLLLALEQRFEKRVLIASISGYTEFWEAASRRILDRAPLVRYDARIAASYFVGRTEVTVLKGDISEVGTEAIASSDDCMLTHAGGVSEAIAQSAGIALELDLAQFRKLLPLKPGDVVATGPGLLADRGVRYIFHAAITLDWRLPALATDARACTNRILEEAEARGIRTLAIPALGGGQGGLAPDDVATAVVGGVLEHLQQGSSLKQVVFVLYSDLALEAFKSRQMDAIAGRQEEELRASLARFGPELKALGEAVLAQQDWGTTHPGAVTTWLREMAAQGSETAGEAVRYSHARWHTHLCHLLARRPLEPGLADQILQWRRHLEALETAYAAAFQ